MNGVLRPYIPENVTVHLGRPNDAARNVTVPFTDYIKNVASSEIYPTWNESAVRANILAEISFTLNRIYTEYYRSRGYPFDITNSTTIDQSFVYGRDIYDNISDLVDELFDSYIRRRGSIEPLFAVYCDGIEVTCNGLSQWGSESLAEDGFTPYEILRYYYGDDIDIINDTPIMGVTETYPGAPLRQGDVGDDVVLIQRRLNRIAKNYPSIPKIRSVNGAFDSDTEDSVRAFQRQFNLTPDGVVGRATWYAIARIYAAVKRLADVSSEGITPGEATLLYSGVLREGESGIAVRELQYLLAFIAAFTPAVRPVEIDGIFGATTDGAVRDFQIDYGLPVDGIVGEITWDAIYSTYTTLYDSLPENYFISLPRPYPGSPLRRGDRGENVRYLQTYLRRISEVYRSLPEITVDGVYGAGTEAAVEEYQRLFSLPVLGTVGSVTWNSIAQTYTELENSDYGSETQYGGNLE